MPHILLVKMQVLASLGAQTRYRSHVCDVLAHRNMTSFEVLKCASCNIVIDELLTFIQNKVRIMDNDTIIRICVSAFSAEDIEHSKSLLFKSVPTDKRKISWRKEGKLQRDIEDIILLFADTDPEQIPVFVAKDLFKLPAVDLDHVDISRLLKDMSTMQSQLNSIKDNIHDFVTIDQLEEVKREFNECKYASLLDCNTRNVNNKRGAFLCDSGPIGMIYNSDSTSTVEEIASESIRKICLPRLTR